LTYIRSIFASDPAAASLARAMFMLNIGKIYPLKWYGAKYSRDTDKSHCEEYKGNSRMFMHIFHCQVILTMKNIDGGVKRNIKNAGLPMPKGQAFVN
jgi:hypothetical protein